MKEKRTNKKLWLFIAVMTFTLFACDISAGRNVPAPNDQAALPDLDPTATVGLPVEAMDDDMGEAVADNSSDDFPTVEPTDEPTATLEPTQTSIPPTATNTATPVPTATQIPFTSFIFGRVYHDECINDINLHYKESDGKQCRLDKSGNLVGNGVIDENEVGLADVTVELFLGACPSEEFIGKVSTNAEGFYVYPNIPPGDYCLTLNPGLIENVLRTPTLGQGTITSPVGGAVTISLSADSAQGDVDFAWDFEALPEPDKGCTDIASIVVDEEVTDETRYISNNLNFEKSWQVKNEGTCTWNQDYKVTLSLGAQMGTESSFLLNQRVAPGEVATITHTFTTPNDRGGYLGAWELRNEYDELIPMGVNGGEKFYGQINVAPGIVTTTYGAPHWFDTFDTRDNWVTSEGSIGSFKITEGRMVMTAFDPTGKETWLLAGPDVENGYIEASFSTTQKCGTLDRYGLIVRSQQINRGYFVGLNCDGHWSVRKWTGARWETIVHWTYNDNIRSGAGQNNVLGVLMDEGKFTVYVNGVRVSGVTLEDKFDHNGRFGVFIASKLSTDLVIYVEEIGMWSFP